MSLIDILLCHAFYKFLTNNSLDQRHPGLYCIHSRLDLHSLYCDNILHDEKVAQTTRTSNCKTYQGYHVVNTAINLWINMMNIANKENKL